MGLVFHLARNGIQINLSQSNIFTEIPLTMPSSAARVCGNRVQITYCCTRIVQETPFFMCRLCVLIFEMTSQYRKGCMV